MKTLKIIFSFLILLIIFSIKAYSAEAEYNTHPLFSIKIHDKSNLSYIYPDYKTGLELKLGDNKLFILNSVNPQVYNSLTKFQSLDKYLFTGKELDPQTGYYYFGARYYEPKIARWLSVDPAVSEYLPDINLTEDKEGNLLEGDEILKKVQGMPGIGGAFNHVNLNFYHYAGNNPVILIDPNGKSIQSHEYNDIDNWNVSVAGPGGGNSSFNMQLGMLVCDFFTFGLPHTAYNLTSGKDLLTKEPLGVGDYIFEGASLGLTFGFGLKFGMKEFGNVAVKGLSKELVTTAKAFSNSALKKMEIRGITKDMVLKTVEKGQKYWDPKNKSLTYMLKTAKGKYLEAAVDASGKKIIHSTWKDKIPERYIKVNE